MTTTDFDPIPPHLTEQHQHHHFPIRRGPASLGGYSSINHAIRASAKRIAHSNCQHACAFAGLKCSAGFERSYATINSRESPISCKYIDTTAGAGRRQHFEKFYYSVLAAPVGPSSDSGRRPKKAFLGSDNDEEIRLARSDFPLPNDASRQRRPSLEREDAFYDATTAGRKVRVQKQLALTEDAQIAELYNAGLLYDNGDNGSQPLHLNNIAHDEPIYPIRIIRARKAGKRKSRKANIGQQHQLPLNLSFTNIGDDEHILSLASSPLEEAIQHASLESERSGSPPMRIIYELGSPTSIDFDASQPPDLIHESMGDYDYVSDIDLDDAPSQEVQDEQADPPSDPWVVLGDDL